MTLTFFVPGLAVPQGSKRAFVIKGKDGRHRPVLAESAKNLGEWRSRVALAARQAVREAGGHWWYRKEPVNVIARFIFLRPLSLPKKRIAHVVRPDLSKCVRAIEDAMTRVVYGDDAQIVSLIVSKRYTSDREAPGVEIEVEGEVGEK